MTRLLDFLADHEREWRLILIPAGLVAVAVYWWFLTSTAGDPADVHWYWSADPANLYPHPELGYHNGYNYSPAFELVVGWGRLLAFDVFAAIWRALLLGVLFYLAGPLTIFVIFIPQVASEINAGNIQLLLALAVVSGFRWPATWAFVLLTKVTPGVGLLWFALRRQWRSLAIAVGVTAVITVLTALIWPDRWAAWLQFLQEPAPAAWPYYSSVWQRLPFALAFIVLGARRGWRWPVVVGATLALPVFYVISPSLLVGCLPYLREAAGRWAAARRGSILPASIALAPS
jgi:hypothetical protein